MPVIDSDKNYTMESLSHASQVIGNQLNTLLSQPQNAEILPEAKYLLVSSHAKEMIKAAENDRLTYPDMSDAETRTGLNEVGKRINPDYRPLSDSERQSRARVTEKFQKSYTRYCAARALNEQMVTIPEGCTKSLEELRVEKTLLYIGDTPEAFQKNDELFRKILGPGVTEEERNKVIHDRLVEMTEKDLGEIDFTKPESVADNMMKFGEILSVGPEADKFQKAAVAGENYELIAKLNEAHEAGGLMRLMTSVYASPVYSEMRTEDISALGRSPENDIISLAGDADNVFDPERAPKNEQEKTANFVLGQLSYMNTEYPDHFLLDRTKKPEDRTKFYEKDFWTKDPEKAVIKPDPSWKGLHSEWDRVYTDEKNKLERHLPELKEKLRENVETLRQTDPSFSMTDQEMEAMFTADKIELSVRARTIEVMNERALDSRFDDKKVPTNMLRLHHAFLNPEEKDDEVKKQERKDYLDLMNEASPEAAEKRRKLVLDKINAVADLDPHDIDYTKPLAEIAPYALENNGVFAFAHEFPNFRHGMTENMALSVTDNAKLDALAHKGQSLGADGRQISRSVASDTFFTVPMDKMTGEQEIALAGQLYMDKKLTSTEMSDLQTHGGMKSAQAAPGYFEEYGPKDRIRDDELTYTADPVNLEKMGSRDARSADNVLIDRIGELRKQLDKDDKWYIRNNSKEYIALRDALRETDEYLKQQKEVRRADPEHREPLDQAKLDKLDKAARAYAEHVKNQPGKQAKNDRQARRLAVAGNVLKGIEHFGQREKEESQEAMLDHGVGSDMIREAGNSERMQLYMRGAGRTDKLLSEQEKLKEAGQADSVEAMLNEKLIDARLELGNQSGRAEPNADIVKKNAAYVISAELMKNQKDQLEEMRRQTMSREEFSPEENAKAFRTKFDDMFEKFSHEVNADQKASAKIDEMASDGKNIDNFLAGPGEKELVSAFSDSYSKEEQKADDQAVREREEVISAQLEDREIDIPVVSGPAEPSVH